MQLHGPKVYSVVVDYENKVQRQLVNTVLLTQSNDSGAGDETKRFPLEWRAHAEMPN